MNTLPRSDYSATRRVPALFHPASVLVIAALLGQAARASSNTWSTTSGGAWNNAANWTGGAGIPGNTSSGATATTDVATFGTSGAKTISLDTGRTIGGITFASGAGAHTIGSSANTLFLSSGGAIQMNAGAYYQSISTGLRIAGSNATYSFTNNSGNQLQTYGEISGASSGATVLTLDGTNTSAYNRINGYISDGSATSLAIVKNGTGTWSLRGNNSFSGGITLNVGTLIHGGANAFGNGPLTINGGTIDGYGLVNTKNNPQAWNGDFTFKGTNTLDLGTGAVTLNANRTVTTTASTLTVGGAIGDGGNGFGLTKAGPGTLVLNGDSTYTGPTVVAGGTLKAGVASVAGAGGAFGKDSAGTLANTAGVTLDITGYDTRIGSLAGGGALGGDVILGSATLTTGGDNSSTTYAGVISGAGAVVKTGAGTWTLDGINTYTGGTTILEGSIVTGANGTIGTGPLTITGGSLVLGDGASFDTTDSITFDPALAAGSINLDFTGSKKLTSLSDGAKYAVAGTYTAAQLNAYFGTSAFTGTGSLVIGTWVSVSLGGGGFVTGLVCDSTGHDIYCRTDVGGAFRWVPGTGSDGSWISITDTIVPTTTSGVSPLLYTSSIAVDPNNANNLYVSVGSPGSTTRGIFASDDHGETWTQINPANDIVMDGNGAFRSLGERLAVDPNNPDILWFGSTESGLWKGVRSGSVWTWTQIPGTSVPFGQVASGGKAGITFVACDPNGGSTIVYAGCYDSVGSTGGVYRSVDGGDNWTKVTGTSVPKPARGQVAPGGYLYVTGNGVVARMPRGGSLATITPLSGVNYNGVACDPADTAGDTVYVSESNYTVQYNRIWRSTNGGLSWTMQYQNMNDDLAIARGEPDGTPSVTGYWFGSISSLLITPASSTTLWASDSFGVARTENAQLLGGSAPGSQSIWHMLQKNQEETYVETLKTAPTGPQLMAGLADVGGYRYDDISKRPVGADGNSFSNPSDANTNSLDFCESNPAVWVRTWTGNKSNGQTNGYYGTGGYSTDAGVNWLTFGQIDGHRMTGDANVWETFDLTTYLATQKAKGNNIITLMVTTGKSSDNVYRRQAFASKEYSNSAYRPTLTINGVSLSPTDDACVLGNSPNNNYATNSTYGAYGQFDMAYNGTDNTWYRHSYLKFDLGSAGTITSATLNLYRLTSVGTGIEVPIGIFACADTSWTQGTLTWNNRPMPYASNVGQPFADPRYTTGAGLSIGGGRVAISSTDQNKLVWMPLGTATVPHYSNDRGATWTPCSGLPANVNWMISKANPSYLLQQLTADRVDGSFYIEHLYGSPGPKRIYKSTDGGATWNYASSIPYGSTYNNNVWRCQIAAAPAAGHVWMSDDGISTPVTKGGLWKTTNGGTSSVQIPNVTGVRVVSFGKPPAGSSCLYSTYFVGHYNGVKGVYRSDDYGATWTALPALPSIADVDSIAGDRQLHGSVFIGVSGRGIFQTQ
jgi:autotransporter-associated beta strand protein